METWNICIDHGRSILKTHPDGFNFPLSATAVTWCILKPRPFGSDISCPGGPNSELLASLVRRPFQLTTWIIVIWTLQLLFWLIDQLDTRSMTYQHYWHDVFYADTMQWCNSRIWNHQTFFTDLQTLDFLPETNFCQSLLALTPPLPPKLPVPPVPRSIQLHPSETCQVRRPGSARKTCRRYPFNDAETAAFLWGLIFDSFVGRKVLCML